MSQTEITTPARHDDPASPATQLRYGPAVVIWTIAGLLALLQVSIILSRTAGGGPSPDIPPALVVASWYSLWVPIVLVALGVFMNDQHRMLRDLGARGGGGQG